MQLSRSIWALADRLESGIGERGILLAFMAPAVTIIVVAQFYPLAYSLYISLVDWTLSRSMTPGGFVGLANYTRMGSDGVLAQAVWRTIWFALASTAAQTILGFTLAYVTLGESRALRLARTILILPMVIAPVAVGTIWRMMLSARVGPVNQVLRDLGLPTPDWLGDPTLAMVSIVIIDVWEWTPFVFVIFAAALASLPAEVLRAAEVDGATPWQILRMVILPMLAPVGLLVVMFRLLDALLTLDVVFTTTFGGPGFATHTLSFWIYQQGLRYFNISYAAAISWTTLLGCMLLVAGLLAWRARIARWQKEA
ncbi:carbohydrate ABC transporter permease [Labrys wisconsinensis]|uniref:ABC-type sugar transport system permease subunit n=1 Tax=Labrys wisconsinensis TaxID=425677 RepID=A0ABU0JMA3_9HYPH|nr:sugar ABC transporter permease [Labrys wisconsinensis]MDQ0474389.1 ABC-type sugar transport system permease subunit [Labrys wisconsinensis]